jgi:Uma2 family endonuclease
VGTLQVRRWTRQEYEQLGELGVLGPDERVELIEGEIFQMPPQLSRHALGVRAGQETLRVAFGAGFDVRAQLPLALGQYSEPEPDVAVVRGSYLDYPVEHPTSAVLVVEVSETTLAFDREVKASLYAAAGIPEYWISNLVHGQLEILRDPGPMAETRFGYGYRSRTIAHPGETVTTLAPTSVQVAVDDLLPAVLLEDRA